MHQYRILQANSFFLVKQIIHLNISLGGGSLKIFLRNFVGFLKLLEVVVVVFPPKENSKQSAKMHIPPQHTETSTFFQPTPSWAEKKNVV